MKYRSQLAALKAQGYVVQTAFSPFRMAHPRFGDQLLQTPQQSIHGQITPSVLR